MQAGVTAPSPKYRAATVTREPQWRVRRQSDREEIRLCRARLNGALGDGVRQRNLARRERIRDTRCVDWDGYHRHRRRRFAAAITGRQHAAGVTDRQHDSVGVAAAVPPA